MTEDLEAYHELHVRTKNAVNPRDHNRAAPILLTLLDEHKPYWYHRPSSGLLQCHTCWDANEDYSDWPCRTYETIAEKLGTIDGAG